MCKYLFVFLCLMSVADASNYNRIIENSGIPKDNLGLVILNSNGEAILDLNSKKQMTPASTSKILTAVASFKVFSPSERFLSELQSDSPIEGERLNGPLYFKGSGDPSFISETMWVLVNNFRREGIKQIKGPIIIDDSLFDNEYFDKSRQSVRVDRAYDSPVSAASFNWNSVNVYIRPKQKNSVAEIFLDPQNDYFTLKNEVKTVSGKSNEISVTLSPKEQGELITVRGQIGEKSGEVVKYASIQHPYMWLGKNLIQFLKEAGIQVEDKQIQKSGKAISKKKLAEAKGWTVYEMIDGMMKYSNNFIAEMLTKKIAVKNGQNGSIENGRKIIIRENEKYGLKSSEHTFISPSGFSNENKISALSMARLLFNVKKDFSISSYFLSSFAFPQSEGTLSRRLNNLDQASLVRGKTGMLNGVAGLGGYFSDKKGEVYSYAFLYNGRGQEATARELFDRLINEGTKAK